MADTAFVYVTYIATTPGKLWEALTSGDFTKKYWFGTKVQSNWQEGSTVTFTDENGSVNTQGEVLKSEPYRLLSYTFHCVEDTTARERPSRVTFALQPMGSTVQLTLKHEDLLAADFEDGTVRTVGIDKGWPIILSSLKSLLETGHTLPIRLG